MTETARKLNDEAAAWVVRLHSDQRTRSDDEAFEAWLGRGHDRADAFAECSAVWSAVGSLEGDPVAGAVLRALPATRRNILWSRRSALAVAAGAAGVAATTAIGLGVPSAAVRYSTRAGEQKRLRLADGSIVILNTDTVLRVRLNNTERRLFLDSGQAFFDVAKERRRPFRVFVGRDEVRAVGTAFDVRRTGDTARVTLEEGRVAIYRLGRAETVLARMPGQMQRDPESGAVQVAVLDPGQLAVLPVSGKVRVETADVRQAQAWLYGRMILDDVTLDQAVAELNRYGGPRVVLADPALARIRVSGVFHTDRPESFAESVAAAFPVRIIEQDPDKIVLASR
ncbi:MAG TPA: FecR domain-containing protein [Caulobacteraceae bacterium]|nr:FecR domain-containing protein [Caulobacteraceae bacterium]